MSPFPKKKVEIIPDEQQQRTVHVYKHQLFDEKWFILSNVLVQQNIIVVVEAGPAQQMHRPETCFIVSALTLLMRPPVVFIKLPRLRAQNMLDKFPPGQ